MHKTSTAILAFVLCTFLSSAYGQFGGGFAPPQPPTEAPAIPAQPTAPAPTAPADPTEEEIRKYEEENAASAKPAIPVASPDDEATRIECKAPDKSWIAKLAPADQ